MNKSKKKGWDLLGDPGPENMGELALGFFYRRFATRKLHVPVVVAPTESLATTRTVWRP